MITCTIKFLLAFSFKPKEKPKSAKVSAKTAKKEKEVEVEDDPPNMIRLGQTCCSAHIEYEILAGKCKLYQIDVLCWPNGAKIYTNDGVKLFKTITRNELTFVPICIVHIIKELSLKELMTLRNAVIEFNVFTDKNKLGNAAKSNKTEILYIKESDINETGFVDAFAHTEKSATATNKSGSKSDTFDDDIISRMTVLSKGETTRMKFEEHYADKLYEIIDYICDETIPRDSVLFRDFVRSCDDSMKTKSQESVKEIFVKTKTKPPKEPKKPAGPAKISLQMQGEILFTDNYAIFKLENDKSEVAKMFVLPKIENLLTRYQKIQLNPITVKLTFVENFPEELFENTDFTGVYCKYSIPCIAECKSIEKPISKTIWFMESHIFPTHDLSKIKLLEFLASKRLVVELYGIQTYQHAKISPKIFGQKPGDANISKIFDRSKQECWDDNEENAKPKDVLLAYCSFDLSSLLKNVWDFRGKEQLHTPENRLTSANLAREKSPLDNDPSCEFLSHYKLSMNQINLAGLSFVAPKTSPLREWILLQNSTNLKIEAYLMSPQSAALVLHQIPNTYMRMFVIFFGFKVANQYFGNILRHNQKIMFSKSKTEDMLTGFLIDNGNNFALYVEGNSIGYILNLWQDLDNLMPQEAKIFFNTDQTFEQRLYNVCNKWSGFYVLNLRVPLNCIFEDQKIYIKGNMPLLCQKALVKLNLMFLSSTLKSMFQYNLFPTLEELVSLDIEYGVPYAWKPLEQFRCTMLN